MKGDDQAGRSPSKATPERRLDPHSPERGGPIPLATGSNGATFYSVVTYTACVYAYNFANTSTSYFRATSSYRGSCWYMDESLWRGTAAGYGCTVLFLKSGPTAAQFSSVYTYDTGYSGPWCSTHAGWTIDWRLDVPWQGLNDGV